MANPLLAWPILDSDFSFNVSHTFGVTLLAIGKHKAVGVDVEGIRDDVDFVGVGRIVFTKSEMRWLTACDLNSRSDCFFRVWTRKEAYLKMLGCGLSNAHQLLTSVTILNPTTITNPGANPELRSWNERLFDLPVQKAVRGALAIR